MKRSTPFWLFLIGLSFYLTSCKKETNTNEVEEFLSQNRKETKQLPLRGSFDTYFNFIPDLANGWTAPNPAPAWYPGGGAGNLTHLGAAATFFNQYATIGALGLQTVASPVTMFFGSEPSISNFSLPANVSTIFLDKHGNSIWSHQDGNSTTQPVSATRVEFSSNHTIVGGTGRFSNATGNFVLSGFFNPQNSNEAGFSVEGWINY